VAKADRLRLLQYAAGRVGRSELAKRLKVDEATLEVWLKGSPDLTPSRALVLADLVAALDQENKK
jgi:DNA-binding transcriptional regulator YdaS (Cro superfamily)